ncbi:MAG: hypothetical protein SGILL_004553 [Bacillariaceae sp.]
MASPPLPQKFGQHDTSIDTNNEEEFPSLGAGNDFPPLGASLEKPKKSKASSSSSTKNGSSSSAQKSSSHNKQEQGGGVSDKDLAAALFRPARPRQNSIESEQDSGGGGNPQRSRGSSVGSYHSAMVNNMNSAVGSGATTTTQQQNSNPTPTPATAAAADMMNDYYFQQQLHSCVEILLSMNQELSEEAATEGSLMAQLDFNVAQYIVDAAMTAPPICRHMLQEGCYRSDCQFSHDVDGHTCLFWIRGRCGKGAACKFFHGFSEKLLDGISFETTQNTVNNNLYGANMGYNNGYGSYGQAPSTSVGTTDSTGVFSPSWQSPSLADSSASNSYSSGDTTSFANIASKGYEKNKFSEASSPPPSLSSTSTIPTTRIPQGLWNPHENRDAAWFNIVDPMERYRQVATTVQRSDVIDLHFQSTKTFAEVLSSVLPTKLEEMEEVWIVTGTGHHVGSKTHQKGGGALERSVIQWLSEEAYSFLRGKDRNGLGGALLVKR